MNFIVKADECGMRLDRFIGKLVDLSKNRSYLFKNNVTLNNKKVALGHRIETNDTVNLKGFFQLKVQNECESKLSKFLVKIQLTYFALSLRVWLLPDDRTDVFISFSAFKKWRARA